MLIDNGFDLNQPWSEYDGDALLIALAYHYVDLTKFLLEKGANLNNDEVQGDWTAIIMPIADDPLSLPLLKSLLEHGTTIPRTGTAIAAAEHRNLEVLKLLAEKGVDLEVVDYGSYRDQHREN